MSNCVVEGVRMWLKHWKNGAELVFVHTNREYVWKIKFPHCFVRFKDGAEAHYVPIKGDLGKFPIPIFKGKWLWKPAKEQ